MTVLNSDSRPYRVAVYLSSVMDQTAPPLLKIIAFTWAPPYPFSTYSHSSNLRRAMVTAVDPRGAGGGQHLWHPPIRRCCSVLLSLKLFWSVIGLVSTAQLNRNNILFVLTISPYAQEIRIIMISANSKFASLLGSNGLIDVAVFS